jgi:hypothetical protein
MRRHVRDAIGYTMAERWRDAADGWQGLPIMWPRLSPWWPWHPAVVAAVIVVGVLVVVKVF